MKKIQNKKLLRLLSITMRITDPRLKQSLGPSAKRPYFNQSTLPVLLKNKKFQRDMLLNSIIMLFKLRLIPGIVNIKNHIMIKLINNLLNRRQTRHTKSGCPHRRRGVISRRNGTRLGSTVAPKRTPPRRDRLRRTLIGVGSMIKWSSTVSLSRSRCTIWRSASRRF